ncbi:MAG: hypothetical protein HY901_17455 [Deltaproteobacteria bacterium]|nr:hypothetical protein [Deltaproteobacteria bacterium]
MGRGSEERLERAGDACLLDARLVSQGTVFNTTVWYAGVATTFEFQFLP